MPSLRANIANLLIRLIVRRRRWGENANGTASRARRILGSPSLIKRLNHRGVEIRQDKVGGIPGEWVSVPIPDNGTVIFYIHGGGFVSCSPASHRPITSRLARKTGFRVFSIDYRLAPEHPFPAALDDVFAAYKGLIEENSSRNIVIAGDSAGGGLVMSLLVRIRDEQLKRPACAVGFSPWADLTPRLRDCINAETDVMFYPENFEEFAAAYLEDHSPLDSPASALFSDLSDLPPMLIQISSSEILVDDARRIRAGMRAAGSECELQESADLPHCWQMLAPFIPEADDALDRAADFVTRHSS